MSTEVVVATVVNTNMSEAAVRQHLVEQLETNERSLLDKLAVADAHANVVTTVLNVDKLLAYLIHRFPHAVDAAIAARGMVDVATPVEPLEAKATSVAINEAQMSEGEFMDHVLNELESGERQPLFRMSDAEWQDAEDEEIGDHFSRYPFLY